MSRSLQAAIYAGLLMLLVVFVGSAGAATSEGETAQTTVVLGETATMPDPSCPESPCQAIGSVTGFQVSNGQAQTALPVRRRRQDQVLDPDPRAADQQPALLLQRLLRHARPRRAWRSCAASPAPTRPATPCARQGSVHVLSPYLGQTVKFGASLAGRKAGDIIGITVPTWAPAFAQGLPSSNVWRASREAGKCINSTDVRQGEPQEKVGARADYGCRYATARLLYTVTVAEE